MASKPTKTIDAYSFEQAALCRCLGLPFVGADSNGRRVVLHFADSDGKGAEALRTHETQGVPVNSRAFEEGLAWAKSRIFQCRDAAV